MNGSANLPADVTNYSYRTTGGGAEKPAKTKKPANPRAKKDGASASKKRKIEEVVDDEVDDEKAVEKIEE